MPTYWEATAYRSMLRFVTCERCGCEYTFAVSAGGTGTGRGPDWLGGRDDAVDEAVRDAHRRIASVIARCPDCGWYNKSMADQLRRDHLAWMRGLGYGLLGGAAGVWVVVYVYDAGRYLNGPLWALAIGVTGAAAAAGAAALLVRARRAAQYDPNAPGPGRTAPRPGEPRTMRTAEYQQRLDALAAPQQPFTAAPTDSASWYYTTPATGERGPVTRDHLLRLLTRGDLRPADFVWTDGMPEWRPAAEALR